MATDADVLKDDDEATELADLSVDRVDGVKGPATGQGWLVVKALDESGQETAEEAISSDGARQEYKDAHEASEHLAEDSNDRPLDRASSDEAAEEAEGSIDRMVYAKADSKSKGKSKGKSDADDKGDDSESNEEADGEDDNVGKADQYAGTDMGSDAAEDMQADGTPDTDRDQCDNDSNENWDEDSAEDGEDHDTKQITKRKFSTKQRKTDAKSGAAMSDGSFPIENEGDLSNAMKAVGRANPSKRDAVRAHIRSRAKALGLADKLSDTVKKDDRSIDDMTVDDLKDALAAQFTEFEGRMDEKIEKALEDQRAGKEETEPVEKSEEEPTEETPAEPVEKADEKADEKPVEKADEKEDTDQGEVLKSIVSSAVKEAVAPLQERVEKMEQRPRLGGPMLRNAGAVGNNALIQLRDDPSNDNDEMAQIRKSRDETTDPVEKAHFGRELQAALFREMFGG